MKDFFLILFEKACLLACAMLIISCNNDENPEPQNLAPVITEIGSPTGQAASSLTIGPSGGTLHSADGLLSVVIPADALSSNTVITIQPITNHGPLGLGSAYRLQPEGVNFARPVELEFHYNDELLRGIPPEFLWVITQSGNGTWNAMLHGELDTFAKTVSVQTTHFSDWTLGKFIDLSISPSATVLLKNQSVQLKVTGFVRDKAVQDDDELAPLIPIPDGQEALTPLTPIPPVESRLMDFRVKQWMLNGVTSPVSNANGSLSAGNFDATYTAPGSKPPVNPVAVSVQLESSNKEGGKSSYLLNASISVLDSDVYILVKIDGAPYEYYQYGFNGSIPPDPNHFALANCAIDEENNLSIVCTTVKNNVDMVDLFALELKNPYEGTMPLGCSREGGGEIEFMPSMEAVYRNERAVRAKRDNTCDSEYSCSDISITFLTFENKFSGVVRGYFSGNLYEDKPHYNNDCRSSDVHTIEGEFNLRLAK